MCTSSRGYTRFLTSHLSWLTLPFCCVLAFGALAQEPSNEAPIEPAKDTLTIVRGNNVKLLTVPQYGEYRVHVSAPAGRLSYGTHHSVSIINGVTSESSDSIYYWHVCENAPELLPVTVLLIRGQDTLRHDTTLYRLTDPPPLSTYWIKAGALVDSPGKGYGKAEHPAEAHALVVSSGLFTKAGLITVEQYTLVVLHNGKLKANMPNSGAELEARNRRYLAKQKRGTLLVKDIQGTLSCGVRAVLLPPQPLVW